jgi:hypothetical protein
MSRKKRSKGKKFYGARKSKRGIGSITGIAQQLTPVIGMVAGALAGKLLVNKLLANSTMDIKIKQAIPLVGGIALMYLDKKQGILSSVGSGMVVVGGTNLLTAIVPSLEGMVEAPIYGIEVGEMDGIEVGEMDGIEVGEMDGVEGEDYSM